MTPRPFILMVDSGSWEEPPTRYFGSLEAAQAASHEYGERWRPFVWIIEKRDGEKPITHVKNGKVQT